MNKTALFAVAACLGVTCAASAFDSDPGYGPDRPWVGEGQQAMHSEHGRWYGGRGEEPYSGGADGRNLIPLYYRPTMRFYGNGYTVSYRFIPVFRTDYARGGAVGESGNFPTGSTHMTTAQYEAFGNNLARVTQKDEHSTTRTAVTSIVRKKTSTSTRSSKKASQASPDAVPSDALPAITPGSPAPAAAPAPAAPSAPAPDASAPAPAKP